MDEIVVVTGAWSWPLDAAAILFAAVGSTFVRRARI
jgi:hypothetical protein